MRQILQKLLCKGVFNKAVKIILSTYHAKTYLVIKYMWRTMKHYSSVIITLIQASAKEKLLNFLPHIDLASTNLYMTKI